MLSTREGRTHGVLLEKSQEQSGLRILPRGTMLSLYFVISPKGAGSWVGFLWFLKLNMQRDLVGHLFKRLLSWNSPGQQLIQWVAHGVTEPEFLTNTSSPIFLCLMEGNTNKLT